jgi:hypothetical protein
MHTLGKWHEGQGNGEGCIFANAGRMRLEEGGTTLYPICKVITGWDKEEDADNAKLIAAAPQMLDSLRRLSDWMREHTGPRDGTHDMLCEAVSLLNSLSLHWKELEPCD